MKAFTDLKQSKKLAEFLPLGSADLWWAERYAGRMENWEYIVEEKPTYYLSLTKPSDNNYSQDTIKDIPCWSLAALLSVLPDTITSNDGIAFKLNIKKSIIEYSNPSLYLIYKSVKANNPVDACYEMIICLNELKML